MQETSISAAEEQPRSAIEAIVRQYVRLGNIFALSEQKVHRQKLMARHSDTGHFSCRLVRENCQNDIAAIDAGIREVLKKKPTRAYVDACSPDIITGWAQYVRHPEIPVKLGIYFDQKLTAQIVADRYRSDLKEANLGSGQHSFEFIPSKELFLCSDVIEVRAPNGSVLAGYRTRVSLR